MLCTTDRPAQVRKAIDLTCMALGSKCSKTVYFHPGAPRAKNRNQVLPTRIAKRRPLALATRTRPRRKPALFTNKSMRDPARRVVLRAREPPTPFAGRTAQHRLRVWEELGVWDRLPADMLRLLRQNDQLDPDLGMVDGVLVRAFGGGEPTCPRPRGSSEERLQTHAAGRSARRRAGRPHGGSQRQRPRANHPDRVGLPAHRRQGGTTQGASRRVVRRCRIRQRRRFFLGWQT